MSSPSLYDVLGVKKADSCTDIKKAYLKLARIHHPDKGGDPERFKEIQRASEILTDEHRRRMYDEHGVTDDHASAATGAPHGFPPGFSFPFEVNLNDLFGNMFGSPPVGSRGPIRKQKKPMPTIQTVPITLEQFYIGHQFDIHINRQTFCAGCNHTGALSKETCKACNGQGAVSQLVQMGPMAIQTTGPCLECKAKGERILEVCGKCQGSGFIADSRNLTVKLVPGTRSQESYIFQEVCSDHPAFEKPGDVHIQLTEDPNDEDYKHFTRVGDQQQHLETTVVLSLAESLMGCILRLDHHPGYDEGLFIRMPSGSFQGDCYCLTGFGMPLPGQVGKYGDLYLKVDVQIKPTERKLFATKGREVLEGLFKEHVRVVDVGSEPIQEEMYLHKR
jgi:DnaJ family protein A protein 2